MVVVIFGETVPMQYKEADIRNCRIVFAIYELALTPHKCIIKAKKLESTSHITFIIVIVTTYMR